MSESRELVSMEDVDQTLAKACDIDVIKEIRDKALASAVPGTLRPFPTASPHLDGVRQPSPFQYEESPPLSPTQRLVSTPTLSRCGEHHV